MLSEMLLSSSKREQQKVAGEISLRLNGEKKKENSQFIFLIIQFFYYFFQLLETLYIRLHVTTRYHFIISDVKVIDNYLLAAIYCMFFSCIALVMIKTARRLFFM